MHLVDLASLVCKLCPKMSDVGQDRPMAGLHRCSTVYDFYPKFSDNDGRLFDCARPMWADSTRLMSGVSSDAVKSRTVQTTHAHI